MSWLKGKISVAVSPVTLVGKTINNVVNEDWEAEDVCTLGITKVAKAVVDTAEDIEEDFED